MNPVFNIELVEIINKEKLTIQGWLISDSEIIQLDILINGVVFCVECQLHSRNDVLQHFNKKISIHTGIWVDLDLDNYNVQDRNNVEIIWKEKNFTLFYGEVMNKEVKEEIKYFFDVLQWKKQSKELGVRGWAFSTVDKLPLEIQMAIDDNEFIPFKANLVRKDVKASFPKIEQSETSGFIKFIKLEKEIKKVSFIFKSSNGIVEKYEFFIDEEQKEVAENNVKTLFKVTKKIIKKAYRILLYKEKKISASDFKVYVKKALNEYRIQLKKFELSNIITFRNRTDVWLLHNVYSKDFIEEVKKQIKCNCKYSIYLFVYKEDDINLCIEAIKKQLNNMWDLYVILVDKETELSSVDTVVENMVNIYSLDEFQKYLTINIDWKYSIIMDSSVVLEETALLQCSYFLNHTKQHLYYSDSRCEMELLYKPDWSPQHILSTNYIGNFVLVVDYDYWSIDFFDFSVGRGLIYNFILRFTQDNSKIFHIPQVLFNEKKNEALEKNDMRKVLDNCLRRRKIDAVICENEASSQSVHPIFDLEFSDDGPEIEIIIPTKNGYELLSRCIDSLFKKTSYKNYYITIIDNESNDLKTISYLDEIKSDKIKIKSIKNQKGKGFSYSYINNIAVRESEAQYVLFLNNDTEVINEKWLSNMMGHMLMENVGVVGAKLLFPDKTIQHAGLIFGVNDGMVAPAFKLMPEDTNSYMCLSKTTRNYSAVTAACMLVSKDLFLSVGMFDDEMFSVAYNDVDFCMKVLLDRKKEIVFVSNAILYHYEGATRGYVDKIDESLAFKQKYSTYKDIYYNRNLSLHNEQFDINVDNCFMYPGIQLRKQKVVAISHNLNFEGAPLQIIEIIVGLKQKDKFEFEIWSPVDGPLKDILLNDYGIKVNIVPFGEDGKLSATEKEYLNYKQKYIDILKSEQVDMIIANTLESFYGIDCGYSLDIPTIWLIHESVAYDSYFKHFEIDLQTRYIQCFSKAYKLLFVAKTTQKMYSPVDANNTSETIHNGVVFDKIEQYKNEVSKQKAREQLGIPENKKVSVMVGTTCERKGQMDILYSLKKMKEINKIDDMLVYIVGGREGVYLEKMKAFIDDNDLEEYVRIVMETKDVMPFYRVSDLFVCTSFNESYPRVILEAMAFDLPIITTPVFGISEQVFENVNGEFFEPGDVQKLADTILDVFYNKEKLLKYTENSFKVLKFINSYERMINSYDSILEQMKYVNYRK